MTMAPQRELTERDRVELLLTFGAKIKTSRDDSRPGIRVVTMSGGSVLLESVGCDPRWSGAALVALDQAAHACQAAGMHVGLAPHGLSNFPARVVRRRP